MEQFWFECQAVRFKKIKMAAKIQDGCQFPDFFRITPHNFCTIEPRIVILVSIPKFACMIN